MSERKHFRPPGKLGLGGAPLGNLFAAVPEGEALATIEAGWAAGVRLFDTAPFYGFGLSEQRLGRALAGRAREGFVLSTKVGRLLEPDPDPARERYGYFDALPFRPRFDYSADGALRSIEASLARLGLDRVDIVLIHDVGEDTHGAAWRAAFDTAMAGAAAALTRLREQGVIRAWGLGVNRALPCRMALERADPDVFLLAGRYTLLDHAALDDLFPECEARGVGVMLGGPYNSGLLAGGATFDYVAAAPGLVARARRIGSVCDRFGVALKAAALQFCAAHPAVASVIPGARSAAEVRENAAMMGVPIPAALWEALKRERLVAAHAPVPA